MQGTGDGRLPQVPGGKQERLLWQTRLCSGVGGVQPFFPLLLHVSMGETEQSMSFVPAGVVNTKNGKVKGEKKHRCETCFKSFYDGHHLKIHQRKHTGERPYICDINSCRKSFMDSTKLNRHKKSLHT